MTKIGFIGCHEISWHCLRKICELSKKHHDEIKIVFNLDSISAQKHSASANVDTLQHEYGFDLHNVSNITDEQNLSLLKNNDLDILFIIGWHRIVPQSVLDQAPIRLGIHSSLLPKDRGSSPINWEIIRGEKEGGVTLFHLTTGVDAGSIVDSKKYQILENETVRDVYYKAILGSLNLLENNWNDIHNLKPKSIEQDESKATLNDRRKPSDGLIDWSKNAKECYNFIRALTHPYPGAFTYYNSRKVFLWSSKVSDKKETNPGEILECDSKLIISTGNNCLELLFLQVENEPFCNAEIFSKTYCLKNNSFFKTNI